MKALGLVVLDKKIFENCILKTYFLTLWPTNATNWTNLNNFRRGPPRDHSREVWSKSNERFQRRRCLSKKVYARRPTDDGRRRTTDKDRSQYLTLSTWCSGELKNNNSFNKTEAAVFPYRLCFPEGFPFFSLLYEHAYVMCEQYSIVHAGIVC